MTCGLCGRDHAGMMRRPTRRSHDGQRLVGCVGDRIVTDTDPPVRHADEGDWRLAQDAYGRWLDRTAVPA